MKEWKFKKSEGSCGSCGGCDDCGHGGRDGASTYVTSSCPAVYCSWCLHSICVYMYSIDQHLIVLLLN